VSLKDLKQKVLDTSKLAYSEQLFAGTSGNLSALDTETGYVAITPTSLRYDTMTLDDIVVITLDGTVIEGRHKPSSEWRMHNEIYKQRSDMKAVVHTHSPYATAFAVTHEPVPLILIEMIPFIGGDIPVAEFAAPGSTELGLTSLVALASRNACLLANHGVLAVGASLEQAHIRAVYTEDAAKIYHFAKTVGKVHLVPEEAAQKMRDKLGISAAGGRNR
jgi:ribulose-5-phosphate 4-epimerase/fuculose-1-phosphate aldolase